MQRRTCFAALLRTLTSLLLLALSLGAPAAAQVRIPPAALLDRASVERALNEGLQLEGERRWGEALSHYEQALRRFPDQDDLQQRKRLARLHYDLERRYADRSFDRALQSLSEQRALALYSDVLAKVHSHYVHEPDWRQLLARGSQAMDAALTDHVFLERNIPTASKEQTDALRRELADLAGRYSIRDRDANRDVVSIIARTAYQRLKLHPSATILEFASGVASSLDEYSAYLTGSQLDDVFSQIEGNFVGLGVELKSENDALLIINVIPNSPADVAGIRARDRIVEVDGRTTHDVTTDGAADLLKGPEGTAVELVTVDSKGLRRRVQVTRRRVDVPCVQDARIVDSASGIAYFRLTSFQKSTSREIDAVLWDLHRQGMKCLVLDLRGNPGGLLTASVEVADKFLSDGTIVSTRGRSPRETFDYSAHRVGTWRVPLVVLIDGDSASASEIFAGAIRELGRGTIVGRRSYGKGSVQGIFPLESGLAGVRLTTAKFYSPTGRPISKRGVHPDVVVHEADKRPDATAPPAGTDGEDAILAAGISAARRHLAGPNDSLSQRN